MKILIIEDGTILRNEVIEWLTLEGYDAIGARDGIEGIEAALSHFPDLIICDITMPRLDGHGVLLELRANLSTMTIPFIFMTARASHEDIRYGMDLGADDYLTKPFTRLELLQAVETRLEKKIAQAHYHQREVNEWQQAFKEEREQLQLKSKLVAMFSHDFRNPLTVIMSSNSFLRDYAEKIDEERRLKHFNRIEGSVQQLLQMLDDMLFIAQMEAGRLKFEPEQLDIGQFMNRIVDEFQVVHSETHSIIYNQQFRDVILADARLLRQIMSNIISNAVKYSPQNSQIQITLEQLNSHIQLVVQDEGIGIPDKDQPRLFNAFHRAENVGTVRGTGLGLAIVKQAVDLHSGSIDIESALDQGTIITVKIPIQ